MNVVGFGNWGILEFSPGAWLLVGLPWLGFLDGCITGLVLTPSGVFGARGCCGTGGLDGDDGDDLFLWKDGDWQQQPLYQLHFFLVKFMGELLGCSWVHPLVATIYQNSKL